MTIFTAVGTSGSAVWAGDADGSSTSGVDTDGGVDSERLACFFLLQ